MTTTATEDKEFIAEVIDKLLLKKAIEWISTNLDPQDVFGQARLRDWAKDNGMVEEENE